jgi:Cof subfamily protein (haloacid dehalogenase superfamily)
MTKPLPNWDKHDVESLRQFSEIRLIALDLDGTLFRSAASDFNQMISTLRRSLNHPRYRVKLTIATGRTLAGVRPLLAKLLLPKWTPLILYNGSVVVRNESFDTILRRTISPESLRRIVEVSLGYSARALAYIYNDPAYSRFRLQDVHEYVLGWSAVGRPEYEFNEMPVRWQDTYPASDGEEPSAILIDTSENPRAATLIEALVTDAGSVTVTRSGTKYLEVRPGESNKGVALQCVGEFLSLSKDEILALGDSDNDAEMLEWAGIGVAISEASPAAVASADYICRHGVAKGAVEVLRLVKQARHYYFTPIKVGSQR